MSGALLMMTLTIALMIPKVIPIGLVYFRETNADRRLQRWPTWSTVLFYIIRQGTHQGSLGTLTSTLWNLGDEQIAKQNERFTFVPTLRGIMTELAATLDPPNVSSLFEPSRFTAPNILSAIENEWTQSEVR